MGTLAGAAGGTYGAPIVAMHLLRDSTSFGSQPKAPPNEIWRITEFAGASSNLVIGLDRLPVSCLRRLTRTRVCGIASAARLGLDNFDLCRRVGSCLIISVRGIVRSLRSEGRAP
jgi:hypothetical protein